MMILLDNNDSFTFNLCDYIIRAGKECRVISSSSSSLEEIQELNPEGIIFSPGPGKPGDYPLMEKVLDHYFSRIPVLGVCLGFQAIGMYFGAGLIHSPTPVHGKVSRIKLTDHPMYRECGEEIEACRYHSLLLKDIEMSGQLKITAYTTKDNLPMSFSHNILPIWGVQYHPEAILTTGGLQILRNWCSLIS